MVFGCVLAHTIVIGFRHHFGRTVMILVLEGAQNCSDMDYAQGTMPSSDDTHLMYIDPLIAYEGMEYMKLHWQV